jgi:hypothetical protein
MQAETLHHGTSSHRCSISRSETEYKTNTSHSNSQIHTEPLVMLSSSLSSFKIAQAPQPLRVQMYNPDTMLNTKPTVKRERKIKKRRIHPVSLKNILSAGSMENEQAFSSMVKHCAPVPGAAIQSALLMSSKSFNTLETRGMDYRTIHYKHIV